MPRSIDKLEKTSAAPAPQPPALEKMPFLLVLAGPHMGELHRLKPEHAQIRAGLFEEPVEQQQLPREPRERALGRSEATCAALPLATEKGQVLKTLGVQRDQTFDSKVQGAFYLTGRQGMRRTVILHAPLPSLVSVTSDAAQ